MVSLTIRDQSAQQLDIEKRHLEASIAIKVESIFKNMAIDVQNLYLATGSVNSQLVAQNYSPEFLKEIRDAMRKSIKRFGFGLRKGVEKKYNLFFDSENKAKLIDLELKQTVQIQDSNIEPKLEQINNDFLLASTLFIANESENQNNYVTDTNQNMIDAAIITGLAQFTQDIRKQESLIDTLQNRLPFASNQERTQIARQVESVRNQIILSNSKRKEIVGQNIRQNILAKAPARSELIAAQNVGLAESWARQTEAELVNDAQLVVVNNETLKVKKEWIAILDGSTRINHASADGQEVSVNQNYIVGGERLKYPRDSSQGASAGNIINCRCNSKFSV